MLGLVLLKAGLLVGGGGGKLAVPLLGMCAPVEVLVLLTDGLMNDSAALGLIGGSSDSLQAAIPTASFTCEARQEGQRTQKGL